MSKKAHSLTENVPSDMEDDTQNKKPYNFAYEILVGLQIDRMYFLWLFISV